MSRKLKPKQRAAAYWVAAGESGVFIAQRLKLRAETLSRWKRLPEFEKEVQKITGQFEEQLTSRLSYGMTCAANALVRALNNHTEPELQVRTALNMLKLVIAEHDPAQKALSAAQSEVGTGTIGTLTGGEIIDHAAAPETKSAKPLDSPPGIRQL